MRPCLVLVLALSALALSAAPASAGTARCPDFTVVGNNYDVGLAAGTYHRVNFFRRDRGLTCDATLRLVRLYLDDRLPRGWTAGPLAGPRAGYAGCRFTRDGTGGQRGFDLWCDGRFGSRGPCAAIGDRYARNCGSR